MPSAALASNEQEEGAELIRLYLDDFETFAASELYILDKGGNLVPLRLNQAQRYLHEQIEKQLRETGKVRILILKGRQQGCSTYVEARFYWRTIFNSGVRTFILTHEDEATKTLFEMAQRFYDNQHNKELRPFAKRSSAKELHFDVIDSGYRVGTAGNKATGRSKTLQYFHWSEVAHSPNADAHKAGVMQAVPNMAGTEEILESTAKGVGGVFHDMWKDAVAGKSEYLAIFIPWYWQDEYRAAVPKGFKRAKDEDGLAREVKRRMGYTLDDEQLQWRRNKIAELKPSEGGNPEDLFRQEYPCWDEEAFWFSGRLVFSASWIASARDECYSPKYRAEVNLTTGDIEKRDDGRLKVWIEPKPGERYVIGGDVAEGLATGDYSSLTVRRVGDGKQCAQWHGHIDPDKLGALAVRLGYRYRKALIGVERNNHGLTTVTKMRDLGYPRIFAQVDLEHISDEKMVKKLGWLTTYKTKPKIIDQLAAELRDETHGIADIETAEELSTFVLDDDGRMGAKPGCFDDRVISYAIAGEMLRHAPSAAETDETTTKERKPHRPMDRIAGY